MFNTPEEKEVARVTAQEAVKTAEGNLEAVKKSIEVAVESKRDAQSIIDAAKPAIMMAEGQLQMARAVLMQFGPLPKSESGDRVEFNTVLAILRDATSQMTVADIVEALKAEGINANADNLKAYTARWSQTGAIIKGEKNNRLEPARYYAPPVGVPAAFGGAPMVPAPFVLPGFGSPAPSPSSFGAVASTPLTEEFPGYVALNESGITTREVLVGKSVDELVQIKGIGKATAKAITEALGV